MVDLEDEIARMISVAEAGEKITDEQVGRWFGEELGDGVWNWVSLRVAKKFNEGMLTFTTCDAIMNDLWDAYLERVKGDMIPSPFWDIYLAFDAGEYHRRPDRSDDPISEHTAPMIAEILARAP